MAKIIQENFRYANQSEKDVVDKAYSIVPEKKRTAFLRGIVLKGCKKIVKGK